MLWRAFSIALPQNKQIEYQDPAVAAWLLDPTLGAYSLLDMTDSYLSDLRTVADMKLDGAGCDYRSSSAGKQRATEEAFVSFLLLKRLEDGLRENELYDVYRDVEMPSVLAFAKMEQNGIGFDPESASNFQKELQKRQQEILEKSYEKAGRKFNIMSAREVSRVLYKELKLNLCESPVLCKKLDLGRSGRLPRELKTNRECLERIKHLHPLPTAIMEWRKLLFANTKVMMPLLRESRYNLSLGMHRIHGTCFTLTCTGRVHLHSPNLQFVPRDFNIIENNGPESESGFLEDSYLATGDDDIQYAVSLRNLFVAGKGNVLLAADYSQIELRVLAHLSGERKLLRALNKNEDIFKSIAATWRKTDPLSVSDELRQQAKKICYGMIYGISAKSLSYQLNNSEEEALTFMDSFKRTYPGLTKYFNSVVRNCRKNGYVTTLGNRRRHLPSILSSNAAEKSKAERQAINMTIQGSAADLVKRALVEIEKEFNLAELSEKPCSYFEKSDSPISRESRLFEGAHLVLQMHDELIYEVSASSLNRAMHIVRKCMENSTKLLVKLPVKISVGNSWGSLVEVS